jgi:hypothetical protein
MTYFVILDHFLIGFMMLSKTLKIYVISFFIVNFGFTENIDQPVAKSQPSAVAPAKDNVDSFNEYKLIIKEIESAKVSNNTLKLLILDLTILTSMCLVPKGKSSDFYKGFVFAKGGLLLTYPILKRLFYSKDSEFIKKLRNLKACLQAAEKINHSDLELERIVESFENEDKNIISKKFSKVGFLLFISDLIMLIEGGRNLFLACLYLCFDGNWDITITTYYLNFSDFNKACCYCLLSFAYYFYSKLICKDFFNSEESKIFNDIQNLISLMKQKIV